jgi:hypothetical protein
MTDVSTSTVAKRNIATIRKSGAKLDALIHETACIIMQRGFDHEDVSLLLPLLAAMPKSGRPKALLAWFQTFSPITVNGDGNKAGIRKDAKAPQWMVSDAIAKPFWLLNPEKDVAVFDLDAALTSLLNRAAKQRKDGILPADAALDARLAQVRKLVKAKA